jgi:hypothetical protein
MLQNNSFLYDTSHAMESSLDNRVWPFSMDASVPDLNCGPGTFRECGPEESYPGMWQIPVWVLKSTDGQAFTMDPGQATAGNGEERDPFEVLKTAFDASYAGNRAPLPFYIHVAWFENNRSEAGSQFIQYATSKPDVYFVTFRQLVEWMKDPVPIEAMQVWLEQRCRSAGGIAGAPSGVLGGLVPQPPPAPTAPLEVSWTASVGFKPAILGRRLRKLLHA